MTAPETGESRCSPTVLVGRYQLVKQIGKGGFGVVEQYRDLFSSSFVAIKTIPARFVDLETKRLAREIDIMTHLYDAHPHVMSIFEIFVTRSREYVDGSRAVGRDGSRIGSSGCAEAGEERGGGGAAATPYTFDDDDDDEAPPTLSPSERLESQLFAILPSTAQSQPPSPTKARELFGERMRRYNAALHDFVASIRPDSDFNLHLVMPLMKGDLFYFCKHLRAMHHHPSHSHLTPQYATQVCVVFAFQLCFGLDYLHKCNIVHRDLKPDNVLVWLDLENPYKSTAIIADFGLARDAHATETFYICTRHYRPPEVITNTSKGETSIDIWSLGCMFYELVTGKTLFNLPTALNSKGQWEGIKASQQLEVILNTIGTPTPEDVQTHMPPGNAMSYLMKSRPRPSILMQSIRSHWRLTTFPDEQEEWIDLITRCLQFFPQQRPTAEALCCHALFRRYNMRFGENVKQNTERVYHAVTIPSNPQRVELKDLVLRLVRASLDITSSNVSQETIPGSVSAVGVAESHEVALPLVLEGNTNGESASVTQQQRQAPTPAVLSIPEGRYSRSARRQMPFVRDDFLRNKFSQLPHDTDAQIDDALDEVLNAMELFTHDAETSRELRSLLTFFAGLKHLNSTTTVLAEDVAVTQQPVEQDIDNRDVGVVVGGGGLPKSHTAQAETE